MALHKATEGLILKPVPPKEVELPNTLFVDQTAPGLKIDWPNIWPGYFDVPLDAAGHTILDVHRFRKVSVLVGQTKASDMLLYMGKVSGMTLCTDFRWQPDSAIHTFEVNGPEIKLSLTAPLDKTTPAEQVQVWLYLTS